jgi:hypothetical protein
VLGAVVIVVALAKRNLRAALYLVVSVEFSGFVTRVAKDLAGRPRPATQLVAESSSSFPSGHALAVMVGVLVVVAVLLPLLSRPMGSGRRAGSGCRRFRACRVERASPVRRRGRLGAGIPVFRGVGAAISIGTAENATDWRGLARQCYFGPLSHCSASRRQKTSHCLGMTRVADKSLVNP